MGNKLKSAWEIALEKIEAKEQLSVKALTDAQRAEIADIRSRLQARIAEEEFALQAKVQSAVAGGHHETVPTLQAESKAEKARLEREMEKLVDGIRNAGD